MPGAIEQIFEYTYPSSNNTQAVLIENIPQTYRHLEVIWTGKGTGVSGDSASLRPNNYSNAYGYWGARMNSQSTTIYEAGRYGLNQIMAMNSASVVFGDNGGSVRVMFYDYANNVNVTNYAGDSHEDASQYVGYSKFVGIYRQTSPITSIGFGAPTGTVRGESKIWINGWNDIDGV